MKNILFITTNFRHGGINKSLESLLSLIDPKIYSIDVFTMDHNGPYKETLSNCKILPENIFLKYIISNFNEFSGFKLVSSFILKSIQKILLKFKINFLEIIFNIIGKKILSNKQYDSIIAFSEGVPTFFVAKLNHHNKIAWIHCDYSSYLALNNYPDEKHIYSSFNTIICVSNYTKKVFINIIPSASRKCIYIHNLLNTDKIKISSNEVINNFNFSNNTFIILTIGSFYSIKRLSHIPSIANELMKNNISFTWYVIANINDNQEYQYFKNGVSKYNLSNNVRFLGEMKNPYPYLKKSNLFVTLSQTEACPYVICESKALHIPIVSTDFPTASEFIKEGVDGHIVPIENVSETIATIIKDKRKYDSLRNNISNYVYDNGILLKKIYSVI